MNVKCKIHNNYFICSTIINLDIDSFSLINSDKLKYFHDLNEILINTDQ